MRTKMSYKVVKEKEAIPNIPGEMYENHLRCPPKTFVKLCQNLMTYFLSPLSDNLGMTNNALTKQCDKHTAEKI